MSKVWFCAAICAALVGVAFGGDDAAAEASGGDWYGGVSATMTLPQGGSRMRRIAGATIRGGWRATENWMIEGEAAWQEDFAALGVQGLWLLQGWELYGDLFGYSRFDPFVTMGARGCIGDGCGQVGPKIGIGAFWHLSDSWALRADADAVLGIDTEREMLYTISVGVQYDF